MKKDRIAGFTIIEMLIVIVIITILVAAGGFYYRDLQRQTIARKAYEDAGNFAKIINDIYHTGHFGTSSNSLNGLNVKKGTYPESRKAEHIRNRVAEAYGDQFKAGDILVADKESTFEIKAGVSPMGTISLDNQEMLEKNAQKIIYAPIVKEALPGRGASLCKTDNDPLDSYEYACEVAVVYSIIYHGGRYQLRPAKVIKAGVVYDFKD